jgi:DNA polymerase III alpha subunit
MKETMNQLLSLCEKALEVKKLSTNYQKRLKEELKEIDSQNEADYFLDLYKQKVKYHINENNLLVTYLLDIVSDFDINEEPRWIAGENPDVDVDLLPILIPHLKEKYAKEIFGEDYVCNIASYTTFGLRSALLDMARVFGLERHEIQSITKQMGTKDEEGEPLTWESALELYDELNDYVETHPEMAEAAKKILNRNRSMSQHASGLIISSVNIKDFVPIVRGKEGSPASAWVEGLHGTDLGAVGLVKYDFLSLDGNYKVAEACQFAKTRKNLKGISSLPGKDDWTNLEYLNDPKALEMASAGDLRLVFQFEGSEGIRKLTQQGGVTDFNDLVAYAAIFRPGPLRSSFDKIYCNRKNGKEQYEIHPLLEDILRSTYGVIIYQEQVMKILNKVGLIPLKDCEAVRKAISKKKIEKFKEYQEMFVENGQQTLGWSEEDVNTLWKQIEAFSGYSFVLAHATAYTYLSSRMLYLKAHHPLEFFCAYLRSMKLAGPDDYRKLKEYKQDAKSYGRNIEICGIDLNKSKENFKIIDDKIYYGFSNIKGIGDEVAKNIVKKQPYSNLDDFLERFGTDAKVCQALISLGCFGVNNRLDDYKYYLIFKEHIKKTKEKENRFEASKEKILKQLDAETNVRETEKLRNKYLKTIELYKKLERPTRDSINDYTFDIDKDMYKTLTDESMEMAHLTFYGYIWDHPLEKHPKFKGYTFEKAHQYANSGPVEILIRNVIKKESKKGNAYYTLGCEDATNITKYIIVWEDDMERWKDELSKGNMVCMRIKQPTPPWETFTLEPHQNRFRPPPKELDTRIVLYQC